METLQRTANRGSISTGYDIDNSLKIEGGAAERMQRASESIGTPTSTKIATISLWVKRTQLKSSGNNFCWLGNAGAVTSFIGFNDDCLRWISDVSNAGVLKSNAVFRDTSAWYHIVFAFDTTQSTASNRIKAYVNGVQITSWSTETYPNQDNVIGIYETNMSHYIGWEDDSAQAGYFTDVYLIDGQQLAPTEFGEFDSDTGIWIPKAYTGTFGDEGYYLDFEDSSSLGADVSGNSNNFGSLYNITSADQATDTPTNNFATFNALQPLPSSTNIRQGATQYYVSSNYQTAVASIAVSAGKWYAEFSPDSNATFVGFVDVADEFIPQDHTGYYLGYAGGNQNRSVSMKGNNGAVYNYTGSATGATFGASDIVSLALDMDNRKVYWAVNGTWVNSANPSNGTNGITWNTSSTLGDDWTDVVTMGVTAYSNIIWKANFGGYTLISISSGNADANGYGNFEYAVPTGFYSLCSKNLSEFGG